MRHMRIQTGLTTLALAIGLSQGIAGQLGSRPADEWIKTLEGTARLATLKIDETIAKLHLKPGDVVADIGAGSGVFEVPLARAVSPRGRVYAVDIDPALLANVTRKTDEQHIANVRIVLGKATDPNLPAMDVDLAFINDVLHHIENREAYLKNLARYIKPAGRVAVIDFVPERGSHRDQPALQVTETQAAAWMASAGFKPAESFDLFTDKWFVVYSH
jgi:ubiquinone/menaquinone biosynthesis C-methylase UbiE